MPTLQRGKWILFISTFIVLLSLWLTNTVVPNQLLYEVRQVKLIPQFETSYLYLFLHAFTVFPVLLLSFDRRVHYHTQWKFLIPSITIVGLIFILWDAYFTKIGVWGFNAEYILSINILALPIEEWLFFITVPFACVFIYECLNYYVKQDILQSIEPFLTKLLILSFFIIGFLNWEKIYTATTFLLSGFFLLFHLLYITPIYRSRFYLAFVVSTIPFLLVNGVLTGGYTESPIVIYNPEEYFGWRISSIPIDDTVYNFLFLLGIVTIYEHVQQKDNMNTAEK